MAALTLESLRLAVATHDRHIFSGRALPSLQIAGNKSLICAEEFNEQALRTALHKTQTGQSDYSSFMKEIAAAGVHSYVADLLKRTVKYLGRNTNDYYEEAVP